MSPSVFDEGMAGREAFAVDLRLLIRIMADLIVALRGLGDVPPTSTRGPKWVGADAV